MTTSMMASYKSSLKSGYGIVTIGDGFWQVFIATTLAEITAGLGRAKGIPAQTGMLFDTGYEHLIVVTTEQMLFSLDIIWISEMLKVVDVSRDVQPGQVLVSKEPCRYFLEVNADEASGVKEGYNVAVTFLEATGVGAIISSITPLVVVGIFSGIIGGMVEKHLLQSEKSHYELTARQRRLKRKKYAAGLELTPEEEAELSSPGYCDWCGKRDISVKHYPVVGWLCSQCYEEHQRETKKWFYTDTEEAISQSSIYCQTELDNAFIQAIKKSND